MKLKVEQVFEIFESFSDGVVVVNFVVLTRFLPFVFEVGVPTFVPVVKLRRREFLVPLITHLFRLALPRWT